MQAVLESRHGQARPDGTTMRPTMMSVSCAAARPSTASEAEQEGVSHGMLCRQITQAVRN